MVSIQGLTPRHCGADFDCGEQTLNLIWNNLPGGDSPAGGVGARVLVVDGFVAGYSLTDAMSFGPAVGVAPLPRAFFLRALAVDLRHQGVGHGRRLLSNVIAHVRQRTQGYGSAMVIAEVPPPAVRFYRRYGFDLLAGYTDHLFLTVPAP